MGCYRCGQSLPSKRQLRRRDPKCRCGNQAESAVNPLWFGDSYDLVKRFFAEAVWSLGYAVYIEPMLTGEWDGRDDQLFRLLKVRHVRDHVRSTQRSALLIDPDTGISERSTPKHVSLGQLIEYLAIHDLIFVFDQSFSRIGDTEAAMRSKLEQLNGCGAVGFYYNSHARFLFAARSWEPLAELQACLHESGLPSSRLLPNSAFHLTVGRTA